jgi:hypothetical protein
MLRQPQIGFIYPRGGLILADTLCLIFLGEMSMSIMPHWQGISSQHPKIPIHTVALAAVYVSFCLVQLGSLLMRFIYIRLGLQHVVHLVKLFVSPNWHSANNTMKNWTSSNA